MLKDNSGKVQFFYHDEWWQYVKAGIFFKYLSSEVAIIVLENFTLKYSNTLDFNDPFDYNPALTTNGFSKFLKRVTQDKSLKVNKKKALQNAKILTTEEFRREASRNFSVTCFSKSPHIVPMWAHYADLHRGCVIGFVHSSIDELTSMLSTLEWHVDNDSEYLIPNDVKYTDTRPTIFNSEGLTNTRENGFDTCLIKAKAWEYEQEVRVIKTKPAGIYPFKMTQLCSVRFGLNIDPNVRKEIIRLVSSLKSKHKINIRLFDVKLDHREFILNDVRC